MPKVIIWRDDAVETEFDPGHRDWRIGRSETNDIALLDPRKSVSRFHAELREENGQWYFIDLNSQNGSWHEGQRVTRLALANDTEISFGDYRLVFVDTPVAAAPVAPEDEGTATGSAPAPDAVEEQDQTLIMPSSRKDDTPTPPAGTPIVRPRAPAAQPKKGVNPVILVAFLVAMLGVVAAVAYRLVVSMSAPDAPQAEQAVAPAPQPVAPPPAAPEPETPADADADAPPATAEGEGAKQEAGEAVAEAAAPKAAPAAKSRPRRAVAPAEPAVPAEVEEQYAAGRRALTAQRFTEAAAAFESVLARMPGFRDTVALLEQARAGQVQARAQALEDGKRLEAAGEWGSAVAAFERAGATAEAAAARAKMHEAGDDAYRKARQFDARARAADAIGWYERAVEWLPASDPRRETARERLVQLKGGGE